MNSSTPVTRPAARRRGRPRSAVFTYYRRIVDEKGRFIGNECQFCTFISRDRSENPTYLTRHILRTCAAPEEIKRIVSIRHPNLALNNLPPSTRINPPKDVTNIQHNLPEQSQHSLTNPNSSYPQIPIDNNPSVNQTSTQTIQKHLDTETPNPIHNQSQNDQITAELNNSSKVASSSVVSEAAAAAAAAIAAVAEEAAAVSMDITTHDSPIDHGHEIVSEENSQQIHETTHDDQTTSNHVDNNHSATPSATPIPETDGDNEPDNHRTDPSVNLDPEETTDDQIDQDGDTTMATHPPTTSQSDPNITHNSNSNPSATPQPNTTGSTQMEIEPQNSNNHLHSSTDTAAARHRSNRPHSELIDSENTNDNAPSLPAPVLISTLRQHGVTKSRRGRPRSPALAHFRRHVDTEGTFIANQCLHCDFVSRDKSENSTLLLRHLLSQTCQPPSEVLRVLQASRSTNRRGRGRKSRVGRFSFGVTRGDPEAEKPLTIALLRFCLAHSINLQVSQSPYLHDLIKTVQEYERVVNTDFGKDDENKNTNFGDSVPSLRYENVESMLKTIALDDLLTEKASVDARYSTTSQLIIHFPRLKKHPNSPTLMTSLNESVMLNRDSQGSYIASVFRLTSGRDLVYLFSKNCQSNFTEGVRSIINEATKNGYIKFDQILVNRPMCRFRKGHRLPIDEKNDFVWVTDVAREVDWFCQQPLAEIPLLVRCVTQSKMLATFFREDCNREAAMVFFGKDLLEKELCQRYLAHVSNIPDFLQCSQVLQTASLTYEILRQVQTAHDDTERNAESNNFVHGSEGSTTGNTVMVGEILRLLLSTDFRKELKAFIAVMTPLSRLISRYSLSDGAGGERRFIPASSGPGTDATFYSPIQFRCRSIANVLPDCVRALTDLYEISLVEHRQDLSMFIEHVACCLLGKGAGGFPPVASGICYIAAFLTPWDNMEGVIENTVDESWERALKFIERVYSNVGDISVVLSQLQDFRKRSGVFSEVGIFDDAHESQDPRLWWEKHMSKAPELYNLAMKVLNAPATIFPVIREISERNARHEDLRGPERDSLMEKRRIAEWNLKLAMCRPEDEDQDEATKEMDASES